jgi:hypothetical protein
MDVSRLKSWAQGRKQRIGHVAGRIRRPALRLPMLLTLLFTMTLGQFAAAGLGIGNVAYAKGPSASHNPNTLAHFRATGDAWGQTHSKTPAYTPAALPATGSGGLGPDKAPAAAGTVPTHPIAVALTSSDLAGGTSQPGAPR